MYKDKYNKKIVLDDTNNTGIYSKTRLQFMYDGRLVEANTIINDKWLNCLYKFNLQCIYDSWGSHEITRSKEVANGKVEKEIKSGSYRLDTQTNDKNTYAVIFYDLNKDNIQYIVYKFDKVEYRIMFNCYYSIKFYTNNKILTTYVKRPKYILPKKIQNEGLIHHQESV